MSRRIVSLVPSSTETLLALGADVVACTRFCEQPTIRHVGGTKNPDLDAIVELAPDLVVLDREENRVEDHEALVAAGIETYVSAVVDVEGAIAVVHELAEVAGLTTRPLDADPVRPVVAEQVAAAPRRSAFVPIWRRPWMTIGAATYGASLLSRLGIDVLEVGEGEYPTVELETVAASGPDLILVPSEPYEFSDAHVGELVTAIPTARVERIDGQDLFWWGSRTPAAFSRLGRALGRLPPA